MTRRVATTVIVVLGAAYAVVLGVWMWLWPGAFADWANFPNHEHFLHDLGAYHLGLGVALLASLVRRDAVLVVLVGFTVTNVVHTVNHAIDLDLGGRATDPYLIGGLALLTLVGAVLRERQVRTTGSEDR